MNSTLTLNKTSSADIVPAPASPRLEESVDEDTRTWETCLVTNVLSPKGKGGGVVYTTIVKDGVAGTVVFPPQCFSDGKFVKVDELGLQKGDLIEGLVDFYETPEKRGKFTTFGTCDQCNPATDFIFSGDNWSSPEDKQRYYGDWMVEGMVTQVTITYGKSTHAFGTDAILMKDGEVLEKYDGDVFIPLGGLYKGDTIECDILDHDLTKQDKDGKITGTRFRALNLLKVTKGERTAPKKVHAPKAKTPAKPKQFSNRFVQLPMDE